MTRWFGLRIGAVVVLASALWLGSPALGLSAQAGGPNAVFQGFVLSDPIGVPVRVRAVTPDGTVCGTADVERSDDSVGTYVLSAVTGATKAGCPLAGGVLRFTLLYGLIDEGVPAASSAVLTPGTVTMVHLYAAAGAAPALAN